MMSAIFIALGAITGFVARDGQEARGIRTLGDVVMGAIGALVGGWILMQFMTATATLYIPLNIAAAIVGALAIAKVYRTAKLIV